MVVALSVVIPVLNRANHIGRAIASVTGQRAEDVEIVVVDGGSTDGTQDVVRSLPQVRLIEAPNSSIYEALNIGIRDAKGSIISHLNSDDRLLPDSLDFVLKAADSHAAAAIVRGLATFAADDGRAAQGTPDDYRRHQQSLDIREVTLGWPAINSCFIRARTYQTLGLYDESLRIAADREWLLRALLAGVPFHFVDRPVYEYLLHDQSMTMRSKSPFEARYAREHLAIAARYLGKTTDPKTRRILHAWHAREMVRLLLRAPTTGGLRADIMRAFDLSPLWPLRSLAPLLQVAARRLRRRSPIG
jgi:glycosyltransferase involved in cell wall biosynthesis